jgi:peptidylprolyl isomerase
MLKKINHSEEFFKLLSVIFAIIIIILIVAFCFIWTDNTKNNIKSQNPVVVFETNHGTFKAEIFMNKTPITAGNFKKLVEEEFYNNLKFHRIISNFMIQGGDPLSEYDSQKANWGTGNPGYTIKDEFANNLSNIRGTLSMANSGPNSAGSQFFINLKDNSYLDYDKEPLSSKHAVFGKIIEGMEVIDKISKVATNTKDIPQETVIMQKVYIQN